MDPAAAGSPGAAEVTQAAVRRSLRLKGNGMRSTCLRILRLLFALLLCTGALAQSTLAAGNSRRSGPSEDDLDRGFLNPPPSARPRVWWHWMNGNVTQEGIKLD